jgi:hypothetical protein
MVAVVGDAIHNLRSSLDYLAYQLVIANRQKPTQTTAFPIFDDSKGYKANIRGKIKGMGKEAKEAIRKIKPYKGGGDDSDTLWRLHKLDIRDKHHLLVTAGSQLRLRSSTPSEQRDILEKFYGSYSADHPAPDISGMLIPPRNSVQFPLKIGDELLSGPMEEIRTNMKFNLVVAFNEPGVIEGYTVVESLQCMRNLVHAIVADFAPLLI